MEVLRTSLSFGTITALLAGQPAEAQEVRRLQPSSKWVLEYADEECRLARNFGVGDEQVTLILDQFTPGEWFKLTFAGKIFAGVNLRQSSPPRIRFGPNESPSETGGFAAFLGKRPAFIASSSLRLAPFTEEEKKVHQATARPFVSVDPPPIGVEREKAATWVELTELLKVPLLLETGPMDRPLKALRQCAWDTVRTWGLDVEQQKTLSRKLDAKKGSSGWFTFDDYPEKLLRDGKQAVINFRLIVDVNGKPESCTIQRSTRPKDFDDHVCRIIMRRAKFEPALDAGGKPVRSFYSQSIAFRIAG